VINGHIVPDPAGSVWRRASAAPHDGDRQHCKDQARRRETPDPRVPPDLLRNELRKLVQYDKARK